MDKTQPQAPLWLNLFSKVLGKVCPKDSIYMKFKNGQHASVALEATVSRSPVGTVGGGKGHGRASERMGMFHFLMWVLVPQLH